MKKYQSKSHLAINVSLGKGKSVHVSFQALTGGGSVYYCDDPALQNALERHPKYGRLFRSVEEPLAVSVHEEEAEAVEVSAEASAPSSSVVEVACLDDAKEYLVERFGISRTKLRSAKSIQEAAESNGVEFVGI